MLNTIFDVMDIAKFCSLVMYSGKGGSEASAKPSTANAIAAKPESSAKPKVTIVEPMKVDGEDSDEDEEEDEDDDDDDEEVYISLPSSSFVSIGCVC